MYGNCIYNHMYKTEKAIQQSLEEGALMAFLPPPVEIIEGDSCIYYSVLISVVVGAILGFF